MSKIQGIKSVDFKIEASGCGVVNWNGTTTLYSRNERKELNNHSMPKLRAFTNKMTENEKSSKYDNSFNKNNYKNIEDIGDINFKVSPLYISQNCIRHHLFKDQANDLRALYKEYTKEKMIKFLASNVGLVRGFVIPNKQYKKTSALLITDFVDKLGQGNFEQFANSGEKGENSIFSKITFGKTKYTAHGSISIEQLQFISLDNKFDRACIDIKEIKEGKAEEAEKAGKYLAQKIADFIKSLSLDSTKSPEATFHQNYVRQGSICAEGEQGILLNDVACDILVQETLNRIKNLSIIQAKGYMKVDDLKVHYNDSNKYDGESGCNDEYYGKGPKANIKYAQYYSPVEVESQENKKTKK